MHFPASESTTFDNVIDVVYAPPACANADPKPHLVYKLSTDPKGRGWMALDSPDDWDNVIDEIREKKRG